MEDIFMALILIALIAGVYFGVKREWKNLGISAIVLIVSFIGFNATYEEVETKAEDSEVEDVVEDTDEADEPQKTVEKEPEPGSEELTAQETVINAIEDQFGDRLIEAEYMEATEHYNVYVELANISVKMDKNSANVNIYELLEEIQTEEVGSLYFEFESEFIDDYGEASKNRALTYDISKETIKKINFDNFQIKKIPDVVDSYWEHPAYRN